MKTPRHSVSGQAAAEFVICLLLLMLVIMGMMQVANMGRASLYLHAALRGEAGEKAMRDTGTSAPYISDWSPGPDGVRYTADDVPTRGMASKVTSDLAAYSFRSPGDAIYAEGSLRPFSMLTLGESPGEVLKFTHEEGRIYVHLFPLMQQLVYRKEKVTIKEEVWMPPMGGLF